MVKTDAIEGIVNDQFRFHYDMFADVLYIRLLSAEETPSIGDLTDEGDILLRDEKTDKPIGITIISWWKRYGQGKLPDSISEIQKQIEPLAKKVAA
ncbi:MAG TPA: DUF2283 domain-containing protein [Tepidisphaeraceae bacterium]|jgi:uncharacterized protein YuzE|nr:DUF2283 domain-containing protein [Tepidisphaeraceae bacterium]